MIFKFFRSLFNKSETPASPLTEEVINDTVNTNGTSNPSNQENLGRNTDVTAFRQGIIKENLPKYNFNHSFPPRNQDHQDQKVEWSLPKPPTGRGGRKIKNKKKHNKLSRRRRQPDSKKNRKSMKHK